MMREVRCSSLARYMKCAGYAYMQDIEEGPTHPTAAEGTACGELLQAMLEQRTLTPDVMPAAANGVNFDEDMYFHTRWLAEQLLAYNVPVWCEQRIDWSATPGTVIRGQYDAAYIMGTTLCIDDLKYGWRLVEVKENWQLLGYAIGAVRRLEQAGMPIETIRLRIYQPRPHHEDGSLREWVLTRELLTSYEGKIRRQMDQLDRGDQTLQTGTHCKYCKAAREHCPALNRAFYNSVDVALDNWEQDALTEDDIKKQLDLLDRVKDIMDIKRDSLQTLAMMRIQKGAVIPGYSIEQSLGHRQWKSGVNAETLEALLGKGVTERTLLSPAKVEKLNVRKEFLDSVTTREFKQAKLVRKDGGDIGNKIFGTQPPKGMS